jgi:hypothetical protein
MKKTYDIMFNSDTSSDSLGYKMKTKQEAKDYIKMWNGTNHLYFEDYKKGSVCVICNETGETSHEKTVK